MLKLQRVSYTADLLAKAVPLLLAKASAEKAAVENGGSATNVPDIIKNMRVGIPPPGSTAIFCVLKRRPQMHLWRGRARVVRGRARVPRTTGHFFCMQRPNIPKRETAHAQRLPSPRLIHPLCRWLLLLVPGMVLLALCGPLWVRGKANATPSTGCLQTRSWPEGTGRRLA